MLKALQRFLMLVLFAMLVAFLLYQGVLFTLERSKMPPGTAVAGVDVAGLTRDEAAAALAAVYLAPIGLRHNEERVALNPQDVGFVMDVEGMLDEAEQARNETPLWQGYLQFVLRGAWQPTAVALRATHDREAVRQQVVNVAAFLDKPATAPQLRVDTGDYEPGTAGYTTDVEASLTAVEAALYMPEPENREAPLVLLYEEAQPMNLHVLEDQLRRLLTNAEGVIGSVFVMDMQTGEEIGINADLAISGLSILKIAIFVEAYRALDRAPNEYELGLFQDTAVRSSNFGANLLLHTIAGEENTYQGAALLTESLHRLGLVNTFMAIPYDAAEVPTRPSTYITPANSVAGLITQPDPARQTTAEDMGTLLAMMYHCAQGGGSLLAVYPGEITPEECQAIIDLMVLNEEGNLIRFGVPESVPVSHKHGWDGVTYGDAGLVFSPGGDYVIVTYVTQPGGWLVSDISFPLLWEMSRLTYNYFNRDAPYMKEDVIARAEAAAAVRIAAEAEATAAAATGGVAVEDGVAVDTAVTAPTPTP
jgi:beta-lactamase class A